LRRFAKEDANGLLAIGRQLNFYQQESLQKIVTGSA
jgi:hypothetical protein